MRKKSTVKNLKDYALWYYFRYYPSNKKLLQKLNEKGTSDDATSTYKEVEHLLQEENIVKAKIDNYIFRNKNYKYIRQKMAEKLFTKELIEKYLSIYINSWESLLKEDFLRRKISNYIQKGKSKSYILYTLWETRKDREKITLLLEDYWELYENESILKEYNKIQNKYPREKIIQKLIAKWFRYDEIKRALSL